MKPIVHYKISAGVMFLPNDMGAYVTPIDHPSERVSNTSMVLTSRVIKVEENGYDFETRNTIYKGIDDDAP